jgi:salicylate hydroxylase
VVDDGREKRAMYPILQGREASIIASMVGRRHWAREQAAREVPREEMLAEFVGHHKRLQKLLDVSFNQNREFLDS